MSSLSFGQKKFYWALAYILFCSGGYFFTNTFQFFDEVVVPLTWVDRSIPYLAWTTIIYTSYFILMFVPVLVCDNEPLLRKMMPSYFIVSGISISVFFFFPNKGPMHNYTQHGFEGLNILALFYQNIESDFNACPSLHVSMSLVGAMTYLRHRYYGKGFFFFTWGLIIAISTLTTKRHFFVDVVVAFIVTIIIVLAVNYKVDLTADEQNQNEETD